MGGLAVILDLLLTLVLIPILIFILGLILLLGFRVFLLMDLPKDFPAGPLLSFVVGFPGDVLSQSVRAQYKSSGGPSWWTSWWD